MCWCLRTSYLYIIFKLKYKLAYIWTTNKVYLYQSFFVCFLVQCYGKLCFVVNFNVSVRICKPRKECRTLKVYTSKAWVILDNHWLWSLKFKMWFLHVGVFVLLCGFVFIFWGLISASKSMFLEAEITRLCPPPHNLVITWLRNLLITWLCPPP